jgi:hypothetical protein
MIFHSCFLLGARRRSRHRRVPDRKLTNPAQELLVAEGKESGWKAALPVIRHIGAMLAANSNQTQRDFRFLSTVKLVVAGGK